MGSSAVTSPSGAGEVGTGSWTSSVLNDGRLIKVGEGWLRQETLCQVNHGSPKRPRMLVKVGSMIMILAHGVELLLHHPVPKSSRIPQIIQDGFRIKKRMENPRMLLNPQRAEAWDAK